MSTQLPTGELLTTLNSDGSIVVDTGPCAFCRQVTIKAFPSYGNKFIRACGVDCLHRYENLCLAEMFDDNVPAMLKKQAD